MPRYEPYKSRYKGNYTRQIKNESKEINLKKPLIISVVFIISAAVIFSIVKNYAPIVNIAIKDFFSINHREAIALGNDEIVEDNSDKLSFLSNIPLFNFFIKSDTNQTLSVMAYETNSMLETVLSDNENLTNSTSINRESLLPFFNENFNTNYYNSSIYRENQNQNISENIEGIENNIINDNSNNNENEPYNYIQQMIIESGRNNANNFVNSNNNSANNNSVRNNNSINNINNNSSNSQTASIFQDILKPKENTENIIKTMKPASTGFSSEIPSYMQNNNNNNNNNINNRINNNPTNNYNNFFSDIEDRKENLNNNNNRERVINNSTQRDNRIENGNNNINNNYGRKNIIEETIFNNNSQKTSDYQRVINDMVNPNNNVIRDNRNNSINNNLNNNANNNINNIKRETPTNTKNDNKKEIMKKAAYDVANYKRQKANNTINGINRISRDLNNIKTKSKDEGIYLVEYDENSGAITLIFRNRNFNNNISIENAIKTLLNGATDDENNKNIISCIPRNTELLDIFVEDDIVYLNFNEDFEFNPLGNEGTMIQIYQLVYTATQFEGIDKVIFLINGNLNETIGAEGSIENTAFTRF